MPIKFNSYKPGTVKSLTGPTIIAGPDIIQKFADSLVEIENDRIKTIDENFKNLTTLEDSLLGIDAGSALGKEILDKNKRRYGIDENSFNWSIQDLENPYKVLNTKSAITKFLNNDEVKDVIKDAAKIKKFEEAIPKMDPTLANVAKRDLIAIKNSVKNDDGISMTINDVNINDYVKLDWGKIITEELKNLPSDVVIKKDSQTGGYIIYSKEKQISIPEQEFIDNIIEKYKNDPRVRNNLRAMIDPDKPEEERRINDPEAVEKFLRKKAEEEFEKWNNQKIDSFIREDKAYTANIKLQNDILRKKLGLKGKTGSSKPRFGSSYGIGAGIANDIYNKGYDISDADAAKLKGVMKRVESGVINDMTTKEENDKFIISYTDPMTGNKTILEYPKQQGTTTQGTSSSDYVPNYNSVTGIDYNFIRDNEQIPPTNGVSQKSISNRKYGGSGIYSVGDNGTSFGTFQMHGTVWNGFLDFLKRQGVKVPGNVYLGTEKTKQQIINEVKSDPKYKKKYTIEELHYEIDKAWKAYNDKKDKTVNNVLDFIESIGEDEFKKYEEAYMSDRFNKAINYAERKFGELTNPEKTFIADMANQHGKYKTIIDEVYKESQKNPNTDLLDLMAKKRDEYLKSNVSDAEYQKLRKRYSKGIVKLKNANVEIQEQEKKRQLEIKKVNTYLKMMEDNKFNMKTINSDDYLKEKLKEVLGKESYEELMNNIKSKKYETDINVASDMLRKIDDLYMFLKKRQAELSNSSTKSTNFSSKSTNSSTTKKFGGF